MKNWLINLLPSALFSMLYSFVFWHELALTNDSLAYLSAAESFAQSGKLKMPDGTEFIQFPPLYPLFLSLFASDIRAWVKVLHLLAMNATLLLWMQISKPYFKSKVWHLLFGLAVASSFELFYNAMSIWSECLFLLLISVAVLFLQKLRSNYQLKSLLGLGISIFLMLLQRNAGVFIWLGIGLVFLSDWGMLAWRERKRYLAMLSLSISGFAGWNTYKLLWKGNTPGQLGYDLPFDLWFNIENTFQSIGLWFLPNLAPNVLVATFTGLLLVAISWYIWKQKRELVWLWIIFCVYESAFFLIYATEGDIYRFTSIGLPFFFFCFFAIISNLKPPKILTAVAFCWLIYPIGRVLYQFWKWGWLS